MATFGAIGVVAKDMASTLARYRLLGLAIPEEADAQDHIEVQVVDGFQIVFDTVEVVERSTTYQLPSGGRGVGFAFRCANPAEVDGLFKKIGESGYETKQSPFDAFWGLRYATVLDPNCIPVSLYTPTS